LSSLACILIASIGTHNRIASKIGGMLKRRETWLSA